MKTTKSILLALLFTISNGVFAQDCDKLLEGGLYSFTKMKNTMSFSQDLRTYYLSDTFKSDMINGKWGTNLTIPIGNELFTIGANDSEEKFAELRTRLLSISELKIESNNVQVLLQSIPNTNLYEAYNNCRGIPPGLSGFIQGVNIETEETVVFSIHYRPSSPHDPMPKITGFSVRPNGCLLNGGLKIGEEIKGFTTLITCKRPIDKDLILSIQTDRGAISSKASAIDNITFNKELPIGTIITSYLNFEQFNAATKNNDKRFGDTWTSAKSKWAPCDGRSLIYSKYSRVSSQQNAPDLRGVFLRGLNSFDPNYNTQPTNTNQLNPVNTPVGFYQPDEIKSHNHIVSAAQNTSPGGLAPGGFGSSLNGNFNITSTSIGGSETRPKNVSIYYYIKIN